MIEEGILVPKDHIVHPVKVNVGRSPLQPPKLAVFFRSGNSREKLRKVLAGGTKSRLIDSGAVVPECPMKAPAGVIDLAQYHIPGIQDALALVVCHPVLDSTQQHIAAGDATGSGQEAPPGRMEAQADALFRTGPHQCRTGPRIGEAHDPLQAVEGKPGFLLVTATHHHILPIQRQIAILRQDKQSIEQPSHSVSSKFFFRYAATVPDFWSLGRQISFSEQALQPFFGFAEGVWPRA